MLLRGLWQIYHFGEIWFFQIVFGFFQRLYRLWCWQDWRHRRFGENFFGFDCGLNRRLNGRCHLRRLLWNFARNFARCRTLRRDQRYLRCGLRDCLRSRRYKHFRRRRGAHQSEFEQQAMIGALPHFFFGVAQGIHQLHQSRAAHLLGIAMAQFLFAIGQQMTALKTNC